MELIRIVMVRVRKRRRKGYNFERIGHELRESWEGKRSTVAFLSITVLYNRKVACVHVKSSLELYLLKPSFCFLLQL